MHTENLFISQGPELTVGLQRYVVGQRSTAKWLDYCVLRYNLYYYIRQSPGILLYSILIDFNLFRINQTHLRKTHVVTTITIRGRHFTVYLWLFAALKKVNILNIIDTQLLIFSVSLKKGFIIRYLVW